jgi:hypothetical protein
VKNFVEWLKHSRYNRTYYYNNVHNRYLEESSFCGEKAKDQHTYVSLSSSVVTHSSSMFCYDECDQETYRRCSERGRKLL